METTSPLGPAESHEHCFAPAMFTPWAKALLGHAAPRPHSEADRFVPLAVASAAAALPPFAGLAAPRWLR